MIKLASDALRQTDQSSPFANLLPPSVAIARADQAAQWEEGLLPEERTLIRSAVAKRQREFTAGRNCARAAMRALGWPEQQIGAIGVGAHREPLLPPGLIGSITHSAHFCAAAVARDDGELLSLGIDADTNQPLEPGLDALLMQADELQRWRAAVPAGCHAGMLAFSLKEAFFKAAFPHCRRYLEFSEVRLEHQSFDGKTGIAHVLVIDPALSAQLQGMRLDARYAFDPELVYSAVTLIKT
ncbi:4'-phosphopantetheinyl transferase family protein [Roseateles chitinivorans]|uniref:4'-phosphopantetheinyl transferase family protein n=1 Tax=Roseateles chitinivorans TaxID=2917965 RepID=UPI003D67E114